MGKHDVPPPPPEFIIGTCAYCGATTAEEADQKCKVAWNPDGDAYCRGGVDDQDYADGKLRVPNPEFATWLDGAMNVLEEELDGPAAPAQR